MNLVEQLPESVATLMLVQRLTTMSGGATLTPNRDFRLLLAICGVLLIVSLVAVWRAPRLDPYDPANYMEVARNLLAGRGMSSGVVGNFYRRYPQVLHAEDRRASAWSLVQASSMALLGETSFAATLPNLLLGLVIGPLLVYYLSHRLRLPTLVCLVAALLFVSWPYWLKQCLSAGADVLFTDLVLVALIAVVSPGLVGAVAAGAALGLAYTVKPAAVLLVLPAAVLYWARSPRAAGSRRLLGLAALVAAALIIASPMLVRNYLAFDNPVYSTNTHTAGHLRTGAIGAGLFSIYWDQPLPSLGRWLAEVGMVGAGATTGREVGRSLLLLFGGIGLFFTVPCLLVIFGVTGYSRLRTLWIFLGLYILELATVWLALPRYMLPVLPLVTISAAAGGMLIAQRFLPSARSARSALLVGAVLVACLGIGGYLGWRIPQQKADSLQPAHVSAARWLKQHTAPATVVMTHYPYLVRFFSDRPTVQIPFDETSAIERVQRHYRIAVVVVPRHRPQPHWARALPRRQLLRLAARHGWKRIHQNQGVVVFRCRP